MYSWPSFGSMVTFLPMYAGLTEYLQLQNVTKDSLETFLSIGFET